MSNVRPPSARSASSTPPEPFLLGILHHLLSPFPSPLPPALLSQTTRQAIHYLSISADDEAYWTCGRKDDQVTLRRQELVEAGNHDDLVLSHPRFAFDLDETKALISLSLPHSASSRSLGVVLVWEDNTSPLAAATGGAPSVGPGAGTGLERKPDEDDIRPGWTFLELQQVDEAALETSQRHWHSSLTDAVEATTSSLVDTAAPARANLSAAAARDEENRARFAEAAGASDCEGTTPGGIGSANDFWSGWSDDEGDSAAPGKVVFNGGGGARAQDEQEADNEYWSSYGAVDSQVGGEQADDEDDERGRDEERVGSSNGAGARTHRSATITPATAGLAAASLPSSPSTKQQEQQPSSSTAEAPISPAHRDLPHPPPADAARSSAFSASQYSSTPSPRTLTYPSSPSTLRPSTPPPRAPSHERSGPAAAAAAAPGKSPQRPSHTRKPSDVTKALPSFPAFPVLPRTKSNSALTPGMMYPSSAPTSPKVGGTRPAAAPATSTTDKSLPPAPSPAASSAQQLHVQHRPETFAPQYAHLIPVGRDATAHMASAHEMQQQPRSTAQGSRTAPLPPSAKFPESPSSSSAASFGTAASPPQRVPEHEHERAQPSFLAEPHDDADDAEERVRLDRLASVGSLDGGLSIASTSLTSMLLGRSFSTSTGLEGEGYGEPGQGSVGAAGSARHFPLPPSHSGASASGDEHEGDGVGIGEAESLRFAMAGLWGLFAGGARTPAERAERRKAWERVAAEVPRS